MNRYFKIVFLLLFLFVQGPRLTYAQTPYSSEDDLKKEAQRLFDEDEFEKAYPLYTQLVSLYQKDAGYNFRLGVCMLFASDDKEKAIPFLEFASHSHNVEKEVMYYLGKAYQLNYRFDEAIAAYNSYKKVASNANAQRLMVDRQIEMCKNGKTLLRNLTDLIVIDKKEMSREDFYRSYDISGIGGKLLLKPDEKEFKTALDKKKKDNSIIYLASNNNQIYFSSYGTSDKHGKDIYVVKKLPNGEWSDPQPVQGPINTDYDEDYPFLHPNGKVLYFCSKGHNSMGGYDIFKSTWNETTNTWGVPVNLDFPINTPDDDILYVTDKDEKEAYFSSARNSVTGQTAVYHINVERKPIDFVILKGLAIRNNEHQKPEIKITVKDLKDNTIIGIYNSNPVTGQYVINLPNGGNFLFQVESPNFATQSDIVKLPVQTQFKPMKQSISYDEGVDKMIIKNSFDDAENDSTYLLAMNYIKEKSKLDISPNEVVSNATNNKEPDNSTSTETTNQPEAKSSVPATTNLTNDQIVKIAYDDAKDVATEAKDMKEQADIALNMANQKNEQAQNKGKESASFTEQANSTDDNLKKQELISKANDLNNEAEQLNQETVASYNLAKRLEQNAASKQEEADLSLKYAQDLESAVKSKNSTEALAKLDAQEKKLEELNQKNAANTPITNSLKIDADNKQRQLDKAIQESKDIKEDIAGNETLIGTLNSDAEKAKNEQLKQGILTQIEELKKENTDKQKEWEQNELNVAKVQKELNGIKNEVALVSTIVDQAKSGTSEDAAASVASIDKTKLAEDINTIKKAADSQPVVVSNTAKATTENNTATTVPPPVKNTSEEAFVKINSTYSNQLADAEKITNESEKEKAKSDIYKNWQKEIDQDVTKQKQDFASTTDEKEKAVLAKRISDAEEQSKNKKELAATSAAKLETLKQQETVAANATEPENNNINNKAPETITQETKSADKTSVQSSEVVNEAENKTYPQFKVYSDDMVKAENNTDAIEKEKQKAEIYKKWSQAIEADIVKKKQELASSSNPDKKNDLTKKIAEEQKLSQEKQTKSDISLAKMENLNQQKALVVNDEKQPVTNNEIAATTVLTDYKKFSEDVTNVENISDEATRENTKADVYRKWAEALNSDIEKQNQSLADETDPGKRSVIQKRIADLEMELTDKQQKSDQSAAKAQSLAQQKNNVVVNEKVPETTNTANQLVTNEPNDKQNNGTAEVGVNTSDDKKFNDDIHATDAITNETEKEKAKAAIYKHWQESIDSDIAKEKQEFLATTDPARKEALSKAILDNKQLSKEKQELASTSQKKAEQLKQPDNAVSATTEIPSTKAETNNTVSPVVNSTTETPAVTTNTVVPENKSTETATFNSAENKTKIEQADTLSKQSETLLSQSVELKSKAIAQTNEVDKNALYAQSEEMIKKAQDKKLQASQIYTDANRSEFRSNKNQLDQYDQQFVKNESDEISVAQMMSDESKTYFIKAQKLRSQADTTSAFYAKVSLLDEAKENEQIALDKQRKGIEICKKFKPAPIANTATSEKQPEASNVTASTTNPAVAETNNAVATNTAESPLTTNRTEVTNTETPATTNKTAATNTETPVITKQPAASVTSSKVVLEASEKFEHKNVPVYSAEKPIPVNEKLPEGLVFKVQIGAFRNPIPQDLFKGMTPITGETTTQGFTRYTAGLFVKFATADKVKNEIKDLGYKDAFVVAFLNGKRIPINDALAMAGITPSVVQNNSAKTAEASNEQFTATNNQHPVNNNRPIDNAQQPTTNPVKAQNVSNVNGLFYTVQVGVFSQEVSAEKLFNIQPLYSETAPNGNLRYNTGVFNTVDKANEAKNAVIAIGIKDAFVTAYYNGKRITMTEAKQLEAQGTSVFSTSPNVNTMPKVNSTQQQPANNTIINNEQPFINTTIPTTKNNPIEQPRANTAAENGVLFKVQLGAFKEEVPLQMVNKFLSVANEGIKNYKDDNGLTIFTLGSFKTYEEAAKAKEKAAAAGITDAFVTAYNNGKKISVEEAKGLINK